MKTKTIIGISLAALLFHFTALSQNDSASKVTIGIEQDFLPYATGGYFAGAWVGKGHLRTRLLTAYVHKPDFIITKGFTNNRVNAYAIVTDYFLRKGWIGWYAGTGLVYWKSTIQTDQKLATAHYENYLINGTLGYNYALSKHWYLSPWGGLHLKIGGANHVNIDGKIYNPPLLNPEASVKIGWHL